MEGRRKKSVKGGPSGVWGGAFRLLGPEGQIWEFFFLNEPSHIGINMHST